MKKKIISILLIIILVTTLTNIKAYGAMKEKEVTNFSFTGNVQSFTAPRKGTYKLEVWGAQGGGKEGGTGGYSSGLVTLEAGQTIYIQVGGQGKPGTEAKKHRGNLEPGTGIGGAGGYNGGGKGADIWGDGWYEWHTIFGGYGGGGATSITLTNRGELKNFESYRNEVLIVAGGGGGCYAEGDTNEGIIAAGKGGGTSGENGWANNGTAGDLINDPSKSIVNPSHVPVAGTQTTRICIWTRTKRTKLAIRKW